MLIEHCKMALAAAAGFFLMVPCSAASTSATHAASATNAAPPAASAPPITDYPAGGGTPSSRSLITDFPLLPQSVPALSIQSILQLARGSACRDAAKAIEEGNISAALSALDALTAGAFHWRGAVTNGYQQGFFVNALRGYCLERTGDIVKAYRAYQNSRAYFDDQAAAVQCPEPRLEVFLGLGRTCLVAGRYTDAFNWLDLVRLEASAEPRIAAAADRALIRRAVEIGDYHDAITNFWDLQALILETRNLKLEQSGSNLRAANAVVDETSGHGSPSHTNSKPTSNIQHRTLLGVTSTAGSNVAATEDYKFVRGERIFSREEYTEFAQLHFWTHQDRPGFKTVLDGITLLGIDNDLGINDPMVNCFLNNIMRADDAEIQRFYDLLGYAITQARALKGDEEYLAVLCKCRILLSKAAPFLPSEDDLSLVAQRIAKVRRELEQRNSVRAYTSRTLSRDQRISTIATLGQNTTGAGVNQTGMEAQPYVVEDQLMAADLLIKGGGIAGASHLYEICGRGATGALAHMVYDGTSVRNALTLGDMYCAHTNAQRKIKKFRTAYQANAIVVQDGSLRAASALLRTVNMDTANAKESWERIKELSQAVPLAQPELLTAMTRLARRIAKHKETNELATLIDMWREHTRRAGYTDYTMTATVLGVLIAGADTRAAFNVILAALQYSKANDQEYWFKDSIELWAWADDSGLPSYGRMARLFSVRLYLRRGIHISEFLPDCLLAFEESALPNEQTFRALVASGCNQEAIALLCKDGMPMTQPGHFLTAAQCWLALGQTNQAFNASLTAYRLRGAYAQRYGCKCFTYAGRDCELLSQLMHGADRVALARYVNLLDNAARLPLAGSDANGTRARHDLGLAKQLLNNQ